MTVKNFSLPEVVPYMQRGPCQHRESVRPLEWDVTAVQRGFISANFASPASNRSGGRCILEAPCSGFVPSRLSAEHFICKKAGEGKQFFVKSACVYYNLHSHIPLKCDLHKLSR